MVFLALNASVRMACYCGKMHSRHLFSHKRLSYVFLCFRIKTRKKSIRINKIHSKAIHNIGTILMTHTIPVEGSFNTSAPPIETFRFYEPTKLRGIAAMLDMTDIKGLGSSPEFVAISTIGPCTIRSHDTKSHMLGRKLPSRTSKTKPVKGRLARVPLCNLRPSMYDFIPCDRTVQRAYSGGACHAMATRTSPNKRFIGQCNDSTWALWIFLHYWAVLQNNRK